MLGPPVVVPAGNAGLPTSIYRCLSHTQTFCCEIAHLCVPAAPPGSSRKSTMNRLRSRPARTVFPRSRWNGFAANGFDRRYIHPDDAHASDSRSAKRCRCWTDARVRNDDNDGMETGLRQTQFHPNRKPRPGAGATGAACGREGSVAAGATARRAFVFQYQTISSAPGPRPGGRERPGAPRTDAAATPALAAYRRRRRARSGGGAGALRIAATAARRSPGNPVRRRCGLPATGAERRDRVFGTSGRSPIRPRSICNRGRADAADRSRPTSNGRRSGPSRREYFFSRFTHSGTR